MTVTIRETALEDLRKLPDRIAAQIIKKINRLEAGLVGDIKHLQGPDIAYRLRAGDYRILFDVEGDRIVIRRVRHRKEAYE